MSTIAGFFSTKTLRRLVGGSGSLLEQRVSGLAMETAAREGPRCENCGFGTLYLIGDGLPHAGMLRCDRAGCGQVTARAAASP